MAFHRFIAQILKGEPVTIFGDGNQSRDFTYISDCIEGIFPLAYQEGLIGQTINIGGKERATVNEVIALIEQITGKQASFHYSETVSGEPRHTWADISNAQKLLGYNPNISLKEGLAKEVDYIRFVYHI
jgi:nucleoside-diphosphate-sugar epimerase